MPSRAPAELLPAVRTRLGKVRSKASTNHVLLLAVEATDKPTCTSVTACVGRSAVARNDEYRSSTAQVYCCTVRLT